MNSIGAIILAAGNSSRLGRPKQLLPYRGGTLLSYVVGEALDAHLRPVQVITGACHNEVSDSLRDRPIDMVFNAAWEEGMASGIVAGVSNLLSLDVEAVIIAVCDQPYISSALFLQLVDTFKISGKGIIGCAYADSIGTPVLFGRGYFERLLALKGNDGAKKLLKQSPDDLATIPFPKGGIDIDTGEDVRYLEI